MTDVPAFVNTGGAVVIVVVFLIGCAVIFAVALCRASAVGDEAQLRAAIQPPEFEIDEREIAWEPWPTYATPHAAQKWQPR